MKKYRKKRFARRLDKARRYTPEAGNKSSTTKISLDEFEALRLCDYEEASQIDAARDMRVSRATLQRLLYSGRKKIIESILLNNSFEIENNIEHIKLKGESKMNMGNKQIRKIAFPTSDRKTVDQHFGHTKEFCIYTIDKENITDISFVTPPPHKPGVLPLFLRDQAVDMIITGGMGKRAIELFKHNQIDVILGASGTIEENLEDYFDDELKSTNSSCDHHHGDHSHTHNNHSHKHGNCSNH
ncbi:MAG: DUF134 domain-containing protein [Candidatus Izimaplasma sp.]|nr:DUF134 domain-containing protein [Candidatus Izimaplasma bacterium]